MDGIGYIPRSVAAGHASGSRQGEQAPPADSAAPEDAAVRCHERCGYGRAPTSWPSRSVAFGGRQRTRPLAVLEAQGSLEPQANPVFSGSLGGNCSTAAEMAVTVTDDD